MIFTRVSYNFAFIINWRLNTIEYIKREKHHCIMRKKPVECTLQKIPLTCFAVEVASHSSCRVYTLFSTGWRLTQILGGSSFRPPLSAIQISCKSTASFQVGENEWAGEGDGERVLASRHSAMGGPSPSLSLSFEVVNEPDAQDLATPEDQVHVVFVGVET